MLRHNFRRLRIWEFGMDVVDAVYDFAETLPKEERYGIRSQCTRAAVAIPSNIAEGSGKSSDKDFCRFLEMALGSAYETETQLLICERRGLGEPTLRDRTIELLKEEQRMITAFHNRLKMPP